MIEETIGMRVKRRREEMGMSREELAAKAGVTRNAIALIERDVTDMSKRLPEVALGLGVSLEWLLHGGVDENKESSLVKHLMLRAISGAYQAVSALKVECDPRYFANIVMNVYEELLIDDKSVDPSILARSIIRMRK